MKIAIGTALALLLGCVVDPTGGTDSDGGTSTSAEGGTSTAVTGLVRLDADTLCNRLINECGQQALQQDCINSFYPLRVTSACVAGIPTATCADLTSNTSPISTMCFPTCVPGATPVCSGDGTILTCTSTGNTHRNDCTDTCSAAYTTWAGSCGTTYAGATAPQPQCWCR